MWHLPSDNLTHFPHKSTIAPGIIMQVALERLAIVEKQRQSAVEELQAVQAGHHMSAAAGAGTAALQTAVDKLRADCEAAKFCATEAEAALASLTLEQAPKQVTMKETARIECE